MPAPYRPREDDIDAELRVDLDRWERDGTIRTIGVDGPRLFPVTRREATAALSRFVEHRLGTFGRSYRHRNRLATAGGCTTFPG